MVENIYLLFTWTNYLQYTCFVVAKPKTLLKKLKRALLLLQDLEPNSQFLATWNSLKKQRAVLCTASWLLKKIKKKVNFIGCYPQLTLAKTQQKRHTLLWKWKIGNHSLWKKAKKPGCCYLVAEIYISCHMFCSFLCLCLHVSTWNWNWFILKGAP